MSKPRRFKEAPELPRSLKAASSATKPPKDTDQVKGQARRLMVNWDGNVELGTYGPMPGKPKVLAEDGRYKKRSGPSKNEQIRWTRRQETIKRLSRKETGAGSA